MAILVDDSVEKIMSFYGAAFDLSGFARLRPAPQGCRVGERFGGLGARCSTARTHPAPSADGLDSR